MKTLNFIKNIILSNIKKDIFPYKLTYALTYRCNSRCKICSIWKKSDHRELSLDDITAFFSKYRSFNWIDLTGGEVFLHHDFLTVIKVIAETQRNLCLFHIPTNGILTNLIVKNVKEILSFKFPNFIVSVALDGPEETHDKLRGIRGNWRFAVNTFKKLRLFTSERFKVYFGMTLSGNNYSCIEETYQKLQREIPGLPREALHFNIAHNSGNYYRNSRMDLHVNSEVANALSHFNNKKRTVFSPVNIMESIYQKSISGYLENKKCPFPCKALNSSIFMDPDGNLYPCTMWGCSLGNIRDYAFDIRRLWKSDKRIKALDKIKKNICSQCWTPCEAYQTILGNALRLHPSHFFT